jgi:hypothetical protein
VVLLPIDPVEGVVVDGLVVGAVVLELSTFFPQPATASTADNPSAAKTAGFEMDAFIGIPFRHCRTTRWPSKRRVLNIEFRKQDAWPKWDTGATGCQAYSTRSCVTLASSGNLLERLPVVPHRVFGVPDVAVDHGLPKSTPLTPTCPMKRPVCRHFGNADRSLTLKETCHDRQRSDQWGTEAKRQTGR